MRVLSVRVWLVALGLISFSALTTEESGLAADRGIADFPKLSAEKDWPYWRGPSRNGIAADGQSLPTEFGDNKNVTWKTPVPGRGHSSPIVVGNLIVLETSDESQKQHSVVAFDRSNGKQLWKADLSKGGFPAKNHPKNTEATPTVASDGERLFVTFFHAKTVVCTALDFNGKQVWQHVVGPFNPQRYEYGYAPSPTLYRNSVIVATEFDGTSALTALDRATGKPLWKTPRPNNITFSTPVVAHVAGRDQLLISGAEKVASYDPANGKPLWDVAGTTHATCGTMVWDGDIVIASGGYPKAETIAIKADGSRTILWKNQQKCYEQSMLAHDGHIYALNDGGILFCWRATDGHEMWKQRLAGPVSSSPILAGGHIYQANEQGMWYVFKPNPEKLEMVAENQLGSEAFPSPAAVGNQLFIRAATRSGGTRQEWLYCFGK